MFVRLIGAFPSARSGWHALPLLWLLSAAVHASTDPVASGAEKNFRVVALAPSLTELVYAAGGGARLVGAVDYSDYPPEARSLPRVGDAFRIDFETLRLLDPDVVLVWQSGNPPELIARLRGLGYRVEQFEPRNLDDIATQVERIGALLGTAEFAARAAAGFRQQLGELRRIYEHKPELSVFLQISSRPFFTVSDTHVIGEAIRLCGGRNVFGPVSALAPTVTRESVVRADPQVILLSTNEHEAAWREEWSAWPSVRAVAAQTLYGINPDFVNRATLRMVDGIRQICVALDEARHHHSTAGSHDAG